MKNIKKSGLLVAAPSSGSGKTVLTLALLRALRDRGCKLSGAKAGPDYIDPGFHKIASGDASMNLDPWAMSPNRLKQLANSQPGDFLLVEGMMGLFDGAADGSGSAASLATTLGVPVLLVVDAAKQSHSIAALVRGFRDHDPSLSLSGVVLNNVGSSRHEKILKSALDDIAVNVLGTLFRDKQLVLPERHLGLVQAGEIDEVESFIKVASEIVADTCDLDRILSAFTRINEVDQARKRLSPLGQKTAIASDEAFSFIYPHLLNDWRGQGAEVSFFSPLNNETPSPDADAIYLPGGYPELHAGKIATADNFRNHIKLAADRGAIIYGECGGYMVLGEGLTDADGHHHGMLGLLGLETSFAKRKLHLGYRKLTSNRMPLGDALNGHEFHYSSIVREEGDALFDVTDALGEGLGTAGLRDRNVMGSYCHVIDEAWS